MTMANRAGVVLLTGLLLAQPSLAQPSLAARAEVTAFVGGTLLDGTGAPPIKNSVVLVDGDRIVAVGDRKRTPLPADAGIVDTTGKWIIPGLIDAHIHLFQSGGLYSRPDIIDLRPVRPYEWEIANVKRKLPSTLSRYLASGVTAVVDVGGPMWNFAARRLAQTLPLAPRVAVAGPLLATYGPPNLTATDPPM